MTRERTRCCCPCMCDFQADLLPPLPGPAQFMHAPRCPECSEAQQQGAEAHSGSAVIHGGIQYLGKGYK